LEIRGLRLFSLGRRMGAVQERIKVVRNFEKEDP